jgi:HrpA-like RNA helicase
MAERFRGNEPLPIKGTYGSNRRGLVGHAPTSAGIEGRHSQGQIDKQQQIAKFRERREELLLLNPNQLDLGNKELNAFSKKRDFQRSVLNNIVTIWTGPTGSGKSTQGIQFLIESGYAHTYAIVPRKIIADNLGDRVREELSEHFGDDAASMVDIIHSERSERSGKSVATVLTAQTFIRMRKSIEEQFRGQNIALFNDEIHELNLHTEIAVAESAVYVSGNEGSRIVLASATMDEKFVQETYKDLNNGFEVPIINIPGRPHKMKTYERPDLTVMEAYLEYADTTKKTMSFTSGDEQLNYIIKNTTDLLEDREKGSSSNVEFRKLIGSLTRTARERVFIDEFPEGSRLAIPSSPAGMSGITNPLNQGVFSDGTVNRKELDKYGVEGLRRRYATKAELMQMYGRAGRDIKDGYAVLTKPVTVRDDILRARNMEVKLPEMEFKTFEDREAYPPAEIYHSNLSRVALEAAGLGRRLTDLNPYFQHKVDLVDILKAEKNLMHLGALDDERRITAIGESMDRFPLSPEISRGLVEAIKPGRSLLHMARAALIAAAIDTGGLEDFSKKDTDALEGPKTKLGRNRNELIRAYTKDDFIGQLDIMSALLHVDDLEKAADDYALQPNKVDQVSRTVHKVFKLLNINPDDIVFRPTKIVEEDLLRDDFTAGMIDLIYERAGKDRKITQYLHLLGNEGSTRRHISDRSVAVDQDHDYIAGFPRWYVSRDRNGEHLNQIIDRTLIVKPEVIARHAAKIPSMLSVEGLKPRLDGGRVIEQIQLRFGSIAVGAPKKGFQDIVPELSRELLLEKVLAKPGDAQQELRRIAKLLEWFENAIPKNELDTFKRFNAPAPITSDSIRALVLEKTALTRDMYAIDDLLVSHIYSKNISIHNYYDQEDLLALLKHSPQTVRIGRVTVDVHYDNGQPYITKVGATRKQAPLSDYYLPDGREILIQISRSQRQGGVMRVSPRDLVAE